MTEIMALTFQHLLLFSGTGVSGSQRTVYMRPASMARRVRSAQRRQPLLSRMRSRWERTVRTLMYSSVAIWASVRPWATRTISCRSLVLSRARLGTSEAG